MIDVENGCYVQFFSDGFAGPEKGRPVTDSLKNTSHLVKFVHNYKARHPWVFDSIYTMRNFLYYTTFVYIH